MNNALVYALANKYDVPNMKFMAKDKFTSFTKDVGWPCKDFIETVNTVYRTTPDDDNGLRFLIAASSVKHFPYLTGDLELVAAIIRNGRLSFAIVYSQSVNHQATVEALRQDTACEKQALAVSRVEVVNLRAELSQAKKEAQTAVNLRSIWHAKLDDFCTKALGIDQCRNCHEVFMADFELMNSLETFKMQMRCTQCRCRHDIGAGIY